MIASLIMRILRGQSRRIAPVGAMIISSAERFSTSSRHRPAAVTAPGWVTFSGVLSISVEHAGHWSAIGQIRLCYDQRPLSLVTSVELANEETRERALVVSAEEAAEAPSSAD